ncbi:MAG: hypothetical protein ABH837_03690 [bacterium]
MSKHRTTPEEEALIRLISPRSFLPEVRRWDFQTIEDWEKASRCRFTVQAILSCALNPESLLHDDAHRWIEQQDYKDLIIAVTLNETKRSPENRGLVETQIFSRHNIELIGAIKLCWDALKGNPQTSWDAVVEIMNIKGWISMPPKANRNFSSEDRQKLFVACSRVIENPKPEHIPSIVADIVDGPHLAKMPELRKRIVEAALLEENSLILRILDERFSEFYEEIVSVLTNYNASYWYDMFDKKEDEHKKCFDRLYDLARFLAKRLGTIPLDQRKQIIGRLLENPGSHCTFSIAADLCKPASKWKAEWKKVAQFLVCLLAGLCGRYGSEALRDIMSIQKLCLLLSDLPIKITVEFVRLVVTGWKPAIYQSDDLGPKLLLKNKELAPLLEKIGRYQKADLGFLSTLVHSGKADLPTLAVYLKIVGFERGWDDLTVWLAQRKEWVDGYEFVDQQLFDSLIDYILENDLPAGQLLNNRCGELFERGYQLHPSDVSNAHLVKHYILGTLSWSALDEKSRAWKNSQWRSVLLKHGPVQMVVTSILATAAEHKGNKALAWLEKVFVPECQKRSELADEISQLAWNTEDYGVSNYIARLLLHQCDWFKRRAQVQDRNKIRTYFKRYWTQMIPREWEIVRIFFSSEELLETFFGGALKNTDKHFFSQPFDKLDPAAWAVLFEDEKSKERLRDWLFRHRDKFRDDEQWLKWVQHFGFISDPRIQAYIYEEYLNRPGETTKLALLILQTAT